MTLGCSIFVYVMKVKPIFSSFLACTRRWWWRFSHYSRFCGRRTVSGLMRNIKRSQILIRESILHTFPPKKEDFSFAYGKIERFPPRRLLILEIPYFLSLSVTLLLLLWLLETNKERYKTWLCVLVVTFLVFWVHLFHLIKLK